MENLGFVLINAVFSFFVLFLVYLIKCAPDRIDSCKPEYFLISIAIVAVILPLYLFLIKKIRLHWFLLIFVGGNFSWIFIWAIKILYTLFGVSSGTIYLSP